MAVDAIDVDTTGLLYHRRAHEYAHHHRQPTSPLEQISAWLMVAVELADLSNRAQERGFAVSGPRVSPQT
jgi:hypothetical protein